MACSVECTSVRVNVATGARYLNFSDGTQLEFPDLASLQEFGLDVVDAACGGVDVARKLLVRRWLAQDPEAARTSLVAGKTCVIDPGVAGVVEVV